MDSSGQAPRKESGKQWGRNTRLRSTPLLVAMLVLAIAIAVSSAAAEPTGPNPSAPEGFPASQAALEQATSGAQRVLGPDATAQPAPNLETEDLARPEAEEVLNQVFGPALEPGAEFFADLEVEEFRSDRLAVVDGGAGPDPEPGLLSSMLPLRAEAENGEKQPVDLGLIGDEGHLEPVNPLVEVEIPTLLSSGIALPDAGVRIELASAPDRPASSIGEASAFYPNISPDTDFVATASPTGVETYTHLRSADAPTRQVFHLSLDEGLRLLGRPDGGAEVVRSTGEVVLSVPPPSSLDAAGEPVPTVLEVDGGSSLIVSVDPANDAVYPILVDPLFESYTWGEGQGTSAGWVQSSNQGFSSSWTWAGANVWSEAGPTAPGNQAFINYYVPRYWTDLQNPSVGQPPSSFIREMQLSGLYFTIPTNNPFQAHPFLQLGLYDDEHQKFVSHYSHDAYKGPINSPSYIWRLENPDEVVDVKRGGFALATWESSINARRDVWVKHATVELADPDSPGIGEIDFVVPKWVNATSPAISYRASDNGLGIHQMRVVYPAASGGKGESVSYIGCSGVTASPCPRSVTQATKALSYNPSLMAQGENNVRVYALDPVGHWSPAGSEVRIKVDRTAPELDLSGQLTEQASLGTWRTQYPLKVSARDGDEATAAALAPFGQPGTAAGQLERPQGVAVDPSGNIWTSDRVNNRLVRFDRNGAYLQQISAQGSGDGQIKEPRGLAVAASGNIWVAEVGNRRLQQFSPAGVFVSKITSEKFVEPWGVATGPNGVLWVTDPGAGKIFQFDSAGALSRTITPGPVLGASGVPYGIDVDSYGNAWIAFQGSDQVVEISPAGSLLFKYGTNGTGNGQFKSPTGISIAPSGNIFVSDDHNRIQAFKPDGSFMRQFGTLGTATNQLSEPRQIDVGSENTLFVADAGNRRIARWSHADRHNESGVKRLEIKVDGALAYADTPGCPSKNCSLAREWTLKADNHPAGSHKVEVIAIDEVGVKETKTLDVETHGDRNDPAIALSGTMTQQASLGTTRPSYKLKAVATDPGSPAERKSGIASMTIKVDGVAVDSTSPGCPLEGCSITREWTLNSDGYSVGAHTVEVKATDAAGRTSTKTLTITIARDQTAPELQTSGNLYSAPKGWVEQKKYGYEVIATDGNGYGVTSMQLKIDGTLIEGFAEACPAGACFRFFGFNEPIDVASYAGGAHEAELVATDGAGNSRRRSWTMNVVPEGQVPPAEAADTLEALEAVTEEVIVAPSTPAEPFYPGPNSEAELEEDASGFHTIGAPVETTIAESPADGFTVHTPEGPVDIEPVAVAPNATPTDATSAGAAISSNTSSAVDTVIRPIYDGALTFQSIREPTGLQEFSWEVNLRPGQVLEPTEDGGAMVTSPYGSSFAITGIAAHDAVGSDVPTTLSVSQPNIITLKVHHKAGNPIAGGAPFVYPVIAGTGWEGGMVTHEVVGPPPTDQPPVNPETIAFHELEVGPPEPVPASEADGEATASGPSPVKRRTFVRSVCGHNIDWVESPEGQRAVAEGKLSAYCGNGFDPQKKPGKAVIWRGSMRGAFFFTPGVKVFHRGAKDCVKGTPGESKIRFYVMKEDHTCRFGPKTSDGNGGVSAGAGNYLRAQAGWELGERARCWANQPTEECDPPQECWMWQVRAIELHLWPSGNIDPVRLSNLPAEPCD